VGSSVQPATRAVETRAIPSAVLSFSIRITPKFGYVSRNLVTLRSDVQPHPKGEAPVRLRCRNIGAFAPPPFAVLCGSKDPRHADC
jgi:hypothetical protein